MSPNRNINTRLHVQVDNVLEPIKKDILLPSPPHYDSTYTSSEWPTSFHLEESWFLVPTPSDIGATSPNDKSSGPPSTRKTPTDALSPTSGLQVVEVFNSDHDAHLHSLHTTMNFAPLLDSMVYIFYPPADVDELDFECGGPSRNLRFDHPSRGHNPGRPRAWSTSGRPQATLPHIKWPRARPALITSGAMEGKENMTLAQKYPDPIKANKHLAPHDKEAGVRVRVSNKWGEHPPAGYF